MKIRRASGFFSRLKGLMFDRFIPPDEGLWIDPCAGIHTLFMRFPIDVIFLDSEFRVVKVRPNCRPFRIGPFCPGAASVLEFEAGFLDRHGVTLDQVLEWDPSGDAVFGNNPDPVPPPPDRPDRWAALLRLTIWGVLLFYLAFAVSPAVQAWYMKKFHPGRAPFPVWAAMQLVPSMYSFENRLEVDSPKGHVAVWTNHYPFRALSFRTDRPGLKAHMPAVADVITRYRGVTVTTRYRVTWTGRAFDARIDSEAPDGR